MTELFRFIQKSVVVPSDAQQIALTADSKFQADLADLSGGPHAALRDRAETFLNNVTGGGSSTAEASDGNEDREGEEYGTEQFERCRSYVMLQDRVHALLAAAAVTDERVNQVVKDVFGSYAGQFVRSQEFLVDKNFASDMLVAVKLVTRFDRVDTSAVTTMRRTIAFLEELAAGRATTGWHPLQLAPPSTASSDSGVASVTRSPGHMAACRIGKDGTVAVAEWSQGEWGPAESIPGATAASTSSGLAAVSRDPAHMNAWWIDKHGQVMVAEWTDGGWQDAEAIVDATGASIESGVAALSRGADHMEVWWIGNDRALRNAWWTGSDGWQVNPDPLAADASTSSGVAVLSRSTTHMEVWWIHKNLSVKGAWWIQGDGWQGPYPVADPGKASASSGLAAVSRIPTQMDVWWVGKDGSVQDSRWTKAAGWQSALGVAGANSASATGGVAAVSRGSTEMRAWWIGQEGSVQEAHWTTGRWGDPRPVAEANSAASASGIAALSRLPVHMELWWVGKDRSVQDAWWLDTVPPTSAADRIRNLLQRPLQFPDGFLPQAPAAAPAPAEPGPAVAGEPEDQPAVLRANEFDAFRGAYDTLAALSPAQFDVKTPPADAPVREEVEGSPRVARETDSDRDLQVPAAVAVPMSDRISVLGVSPSVLEAMQPVVRDYLESQIPDLSQASVEDVVDVVKGRWLDLAREVEPLRRPAPAKIFRLGGNLFAVQESEAGPAPVPLDETPDFSHAITRPVGVGDLQVVRQTLVGYEAADVSHIENVLPGELLRRTTTREETTELTITDETETTRSQERDTQTTERNELATETQKEASEQSTTTAGQTTSSDYGRLVENSKTNYARSLTDRAVNRVTQTVRQQRVQREKKVLTDEAVHQLDNSTGQQTVRGIYQWVDKKYQVKVLNYGKRLLYDVVLPEPAAFLIESLKKAAQPENFQLTKPSEPTVRKVVSGGPGFFFPQWRPLEPQDLNEGNYEGYATTYGVSGAVKPPPREYIRVVAKTDKVYVQDNKITSYGKPDQDKMWYDAFTLTIPEGYKAVGGYIATTEPFIIQDSEFPQELYDFWIGRQFVRFGLSSPYRQTFTLFGEVGTIPCQLLVWPAINQMSYGISIKCQRDEALKKWQLETHATIIAGYHRQRTNYLDELAKYQSAVRAQMAFGQGFSRDSALERQELKKAFVHLLMAEHFANVHYPTPDPTAFPPDPAYVKKWGAVTAFFERAFEWEHLMYLYYPYFWGRQAKWGDLILIQDLDPQFEAFLKAGAARVVIPVRPGFEGALAHYHETGDVWMGEEIPDMYSKQYVSIMAEIKARNTAPGGEVCVDEWEVRLPTTLVMARDNGELPKWTPVPCHPDSDA